MSTYQPVSRRPIADAFRATARLAVQACVALNIHPDLISYLSMVAALGGAVCLWFAASRPILLILVPAFLYLRLWLNMLDGMVALASGKASARGEILNDLPDRVSDVLIFAGLAHSGLCNAFLSYWVAIFALLTAYVGTFGQAVGVQREFSGVMSKPWRMVMLHLGAWMTAGLMMAGKGNPDLARLTVLDWTCIVIILGCVQTVWIRLVRIMRSLQAKGSSGKGA